MEQQRTVDGTTRIIVLTDEGEWNVFISFRSGEAVADEMLRLVRETHPDRVFAVDT